MTSFNIQTFSGFQRRGSASCFVEKKTETHVGPGGFVGKMSLVDGQHRCVIAQSLRPSSAHRYDEMFLRRLFWRGIAPLLPLLFFAQPAAADAGDTINLNVSTTVQHDSNLFRLPSSADPNTVLGNPSKSEQISVTSVGFKVNKPYALQRFELEATAIDYRFQTFDYLNYTARNYAAAWRWKLTPYLYGNLTSTRNETLNNFADYTGYKTRNLNTEENRRFDGVFEISGAWRILGGVAEYTRTNTLLFTQESDSRNNTVEAGILYVFRSGSSLAYTVRTGRGEYTNLPQPIESGLFDNRFDDRENEVHLIWALTGKTSLDARVAHLERKHTHFAARDYGGNTGNCNFNWQINGNISLTASWARELSSYQDNSTSFTSTNRFSLTPFWQLSANTGLRLRYDHAQRDFRGAIVSTPLNDRVDTQSTGMISLEWQPLHMLSVSTSLQSDRRESNQTGLDYAARIASVSAQLSF
jgi:exopolysaccharide biosynthesis operon protein EpsL